MKMPYRILLVDDDKDFREEFIEYLEEYKITEASSGEQALNLIEEPNEIDLVILDVMMPGLSGTEVLKRMKKMSPDLGIIILTGYSSKDIIIEALKGHADDYIEKPLHIDQTKRIIERILESKQESIDIDGSDITAKVERVKRFLERNYNKKVSLKVAAETVCLSPKYLSRIFKENTGIGFNEFKLKIKIEKAKHLLNKGGYNINQVAYKLGYKNTESFMRMFKRNTGHTPSYFKKKNMLVKRLKGEKSVKAFQQTNI
ncbi:MAG: response regulator [bacterium]